MPFLPPALTDLDREEATSYLPRPPHFRRIRLGVQDAALSRR